MKLWLYFFLVIGFLGGNGQTMDELEAAEDAPKPLFLSALVQHGGHVCRLFDAPHKVRAFSSQFSFPKPLNEVELDMSGETSSTSSLKKIDIGEKYIAEDKNLKIQTQHLEKCIGVSVWSPNSRIPCLYHAPMTHLGENSEVFKAFFLSALLKKNIDPPQTDINIVSSYWSDHTVQAIKLIEEAGFKIAGLSIPDALVEYHEKGVDIFINQATVSERYLNLQKVKGSTMAIDARTGKIGFKHECNCDFCRDF